MTLKTIVKNQRIVIAGVSTALVVVLLGAGAVGYTWSHQDVFYPGVSVGSIELGGLTKEEGRALLHDRVGELLETGAQVRIEDQVQTIALQTLSPDDPDLARDIVIVHVDELADAGFEIGHTGSLFAQTGDALRTLLGSAPLQAEVSVEERVIEEALMEAFADFHNPAVDPAFEIAKNEEGLWSVDVLEGSTGTTFSTEEALSTMTNQLAQLQLEEIALTIADEAPSMSEEQAEDLSDSAVRVLEQAPYLLEYEESRFERFSYSLSSAQLAEALAPSLHEGSPRLTLNETLDTFFAEIEEDINVEPSNARFDTDGTYVREFAPSKQGRAVDLERTRSQLHDLLAAAAACTEECETEYEPVLISVDVTEPEITTESVNDLGITEVLGVGISDFSGSPSNRIKNIRHGISKLNGILIAPDEEFSLIEKLKPFTISDGYLPELVIKGDEIKPEVGGGLCQIGSTTFRAVMNSGLNITQRRNHSLVVNYYNDPSNGNPGTDATLYDPAPDFRFVNDTGHHILLRTEMNVSTGELKFTFWGTSDGRKGYYSAPVVHNWIPAGPTQTTYTTDLAPGQRKCQGAHPGANTSFTYTIEQADGEVDETLYESHYRALPTICLVGVAEDELDEDGNYIPPEERVSEETSEDTDAEEGEPESSSEDATTPESTETMESSTAPDETPSEA